MAFLYGSAREKQDYIVKSRYKKKLSSTLKFYQLMILGWVDLIILNNFALSQHK